MSFLVGGLGKAVSVGSRENAGRGNTSWPAACTALPKFAEAGLGRCANKEVLGFLVVDAVRLMPSPLR
ncbi:hypothetical protein ES702_05522 [subsurface metagenome]